MFLRRSAKSFSLEVTVDSLKACCKPACSEDNVQLAINATRRSGHEHHPKHHPASQVQPPPLPLEQYRYTIVYTPMNVTILNFIPQSPETQCHYQKHTLNTTGWAPPATSASLQKSRAQATTVHNL
eukprot:1416959-Pleurochrysis_carterae.AAC.1